jgi:hypothetical protein
MNEMKMNVANSIDQKPQINPWKNQRLIHLLIGLLDAIISP